MSKHTPGPRGGHGIATGLSVRDWFAGQALQGMLGSDSSYSFLGAANDAYRFADAMLAERG